MIRVLVFFIVVGLLAYGAALLADRPGDVIVTWQGLRIETSLMVTGAAVLAALGLLALIWSLVRALVRSPLLLANFLHNRRGVRAYEAISKGLIAVGSGDMAAAQKHTLEVNRIAAGEPLALLLSAQSAQLTGDREGAERAFRTMAARPDTKALGLHGLYVEAQRRDDLASARAYAEEAARTAPSLGWASKAVLEFRCATGDWAGALALLESSKGALDKTSYRRRRAVLLTARAIAAEDSDRDSAKVLVLEAVKLAPTLVPAAALAGRLLAEGGEQRKAVRIIEKAWRENPHPDLAETFSNLRSGDAARDRLIRIERLAKKTPGNIEGALATARSALDAREYARARSALEPYLAAPTRRIALLMAEIERADRNDEGRAREWVARAVHAAPDPAWTADGYVSDHWLPISPVTGRLDAFTWRVPLMGIVGTAPVIEPEPATAALPDATPGHQIQQGDTPAPSDPPATSETSAVATPVRQRTRGPQQKPEPVIPLVHAPDDPGPDAAEPTDTAPETQNGGWRKILE